MHTCQNRKERSWIDRGEKSIFVGYDTKSKAYRLYNPLNKKVIISRDVEFDEEDYWCWTKEEKHVRGMFFDNEDDELREVEKANNQNPSPSPSPSTPAASSNEASSSGGAPRKSRSLREVYEVTDPIEMTDDYTLFCLLAECDPVTYEEVVQEAK